MPAIYFRTDGNEDIATGHIMRCLSIARACAVRRAKVCFLVADETSVSALRERFVRPDEFTVHCLHSDYKEPESELPALRSIVSESSCIFLDSYFVTKKYLQELQKLYKVAYLDDLLAFDYLADLIVNYDILERPACYRHAETVLIGASYTPLREQFSAASYEVHPQVQNILLSTGGTDSYDIAGQLLAMIFAGTDNRLQSYHYHVVTSRFNRHLGKLQDFSHLHPTIHIHENIQDMAAFMCGCDLAISAGGTTLYELCAVGVPSVSFSTADNQLHAVETMSHEQIVPYAGDVRSTGRNALNAMLSFLCEYGSSYEKRKKSSQKMRAFVDGEGATRISEALLQYVKR
ncbi:MAG: UDP-2,4-diacetamido-2,4,6-trideoxy-beta-L-altropyranose hydrolase [Ruminococcus sp.]|nr:UDP-2,4-diacetamido-2,4,6-trideoxy-beta-L-altropyranose hydrolase [Ruminococcus sp.]